MKHKQFIDKMATTISDFIMNNGMDEQTSAKLWDDMADRIGSLMRKAKYDLVKGEFKE